METSLKDLGIQNQAMSFQEMTNAMREKRVVQPPPPPTIPQANPIIMPDANMPMPPMPVQTKGGQLPHPSITQAPTNVQLPFAGEVQNAVVTNPTVNTGSSQGSKENKGGFCLDGHQKEMIILALIAGAISSSTAQEKLGELSYLRDNRILKAAASGAIVAIAYMIARKFLS